MSDDLPLGSLTLENAGAIGPLDEVEAKLDQVKEKATEAHEGGLKGLIEGFGELTIAGFGVEEIISKVEELGHALVEAAVDAENHARALDALGEGADRVADATNDVVEAEDAWHTQQRLTQAGLHVTADQLAAITQRAREYAIQTGTTTPAALEQLTSALLSGAERGLRPFGLDVGNAHDRTEAFNSALGQLERRASEAGPSARTLGEDVHRTSNNLHDAISAAAGWIAEMSGFQSVISGIGDALGSLSEKAEDATSALDRARQHAQQATSAVSGGVRATNRAAVVAGLRRAGVANLQDLFSPGQSAELEGLSEGLTHHGFSLDQLSDAALARAAEIMDARNGDTTARGESGTELFDLARGSLDEAATSQANQTVADRETAIRERVARLREQQRERGLDREARRRAGIREPGTGTHHTRSREANGEDTKEAEARAEAFRLETEQLERQKGKLTELIDVETREAQTAMEGERAKLQAANEATLAYERQHNTLAQLGDRIQQHAELHQTSAQATADIVEGAYNTMTSAASQHYRALLQGSESLGTALAEESKDVLLGLSEQAAGKAVFQLAEGFANLARAAASYGADAGAEAAATSNFISAAEFAAIAGVSGAAYAGVNAATKPQQSVPAGSNGAGRLNAGASGSPHDYDSQGASGGKVEINLTVGGNVYGREHAEHEIHALMKSAAMNAADFHGLTARWNG